MARRKKEQQEPNAQPMSKQELQPIVEEFMKRFNTIKQEQELLKEDEKSLIEEFSERLDTKTLKQAMQAVNVKRKVKHKDTFDLLVELVEELETV